MSSDLQWPEIKSLSRMMYDQSLSDPCAMRVSSFFVVPSSTLQCWLKTYWHVWNMATSYLVIL